MNRNLYNGIIPALYACYDKDGNISSENVEKLTQFYIDKGVKGLYVGGSSGECIYQSVSERKLVLESVMKVAKGKITVIAHVACNNTKDSMELASHAESLGVNAIASIPPIYFKLPEHAIAAYWNDISSAAPHTDFIIYNIPQLVGVSLSTSLYQKMCENKRVIGVKNSSMPVQDIQMFKSFEPDTHVVFNGPDEQLLGGLAIGADGGIGGTYGVMPDLYLEIMECFKRDHIERARDIQNICCDIIYKMCSAKGNLYAVMKEIIKRRNGIDCGSVRAPLAPVCEEDSVVIDEAVTMIERAYSQYID